MSDASELLAAGAVLPRGTEDAGESAVLLTARTYRHPALDDRVLVRLTAADLGLGEDQASGYLGMERVGEPAEVGFGRRTALGFPEWVLVHHPDDGHHALAVMPELKKIDQRAKNKPKAALDAFHELAGRLASSVPHLLPTYYERAARTFLGVENVVYATQMFNHARKAEAEHGLPIDDERHDAVFLEFALAGALPVKALSGYAKELASRVSAEEALRRFTKLCLRRTASGLPPSAQMAVELRRLAKAAGESAEAVEHDYLAELLAFPATGRSAAGWWKAHRAALITLARRRPEVRGTLLNMLPVTDDRDFPTMWLDILEESGTTAGLCAPEGEPEAALPQDGSVGWLKRFLGFCGSGWGQTIPPAMLPLAERMTDRLRTELTASGEGFAPLAEADLLDLLLARDVPVADPSKGFRLNLTAWARNGQRRDLLALEADARFRQAFHNGAEAISNDEEGRHALSSLMASPGGRAPLTEWVGEVARRATDTGLPGLPNAMNKLRWLPGEVLLLNEEAVRAAVTLSLAPVLTRTLRAGIFDEMHWPAWEQAVAELAPAKKPTDIRVADAWPYLIVAGPTQVRVLGPDGPVLVHDLRIPAGDSRNVGFGYVDGELLVRWYSYQQGKTVGYWHTDAGQPRPVEGDLPETKSMYWHTNEQRISLPLAGGGHTTGAGTVHRGDTVLPWHRPVVTDGTSYWVLARRKDERNNTLVWHEYDPVSGDLGRESMPGFFTDGVREAPDSSFHSGWLLPVPTGEPTPSGTPVNGLLGWRVVQQADGSLRSEDLAGNRITTPSGTVPFSGLFVPGDDRPRAVLVRSYQASIVDQDGFVTASVKTDAVPGEFARGTTLLPPVRYWHWLRPRDPRGSQALRRIDDERVLALIKAVAAAGDEDPAEAIRAVLPEVTHEALIAGLAGVAKYTAVQQDLLDKAAERLEAALDPSSVQEEEPPGPSDALIGAALASVGPVSAHARNAPSGLFDRLRVLKRAMADDADPEQKPRIHLDGVGLPPSDLLFHTLLRAPAAMVYRAVTPYNDPEQQEALRDLLTVFGELGLIEQEQRPERWRRFELRLEEGLTDPDGRWRDGHWTGLLPLGGGAFLAFVHHSRSGTGADFTALFHDPAGLFEVPAPYLVRSSEPAVTAEHVLAYEAFLAEAAERGPAPWFPEAAEEFARLTGTTVTAAKLVIAALPSISSWERNFLDPELRAMLGLKVADAAFAKDGLRKLKSRVRRRLVSALLPADPAALWTDGPDVAAAAEVWNAEFGRRVAVPEALLTEAAKAVRTGWDTTEALPALLDPASEPQLSRDSKWEVKGDKAVPADPAVRGFDATTLSTAVALTAWLAHRLPAGDPMRDRLPAALTAVRDRLANPDLMLVADQYVNLPDFRKAAGTPTETGPGYEQYGAVVMATSDNLPYPAVRTALLDGTGSDPYLALLRAEVPRLASLELPWRIALGERFAALLADPGDPAAGERDADGTWWPQDPSRSVPDLVAEVAERHGLGADAAVVYLMLLAMPDPSDKNTARWTGWKPARLKAARAELAATDLVVEASRSRAGRSLFLPGGWSELKSPCLPLEEWKLPLYDLTAGEARPLLGVAVPFEPVADLYGRAWRRIVDGDVPRFADLEIRRGRRR